MYAAAVVFWEALVARRLFQADSPGGALTKILRDTVKPPSELAADVPRALDDVILKGLARNADDRYPTARAMALAIRSA